MYIFVNSHRIKCSFALTSLRDRSKNSAHEWGDSSEFGIKVFEYTHSLVSYNLIKGLQPIFWDFKYNKTVAILMPNSMKDIMMEYTTNMHGRRDITLHVHLLILIVGNLIQFIIF